MPLWLRRIIAALCGVFAVSAAYLFLSHLNARDIVHLYARSIVSNVFEIFEYSGPNWAGQRSMQNNYFPRAAAEGRVPVSFPVSSDMYQFRIDPGEKPETVSIVRVCLERALFVTRCIDGAGLLAYIDMAHEAALSRNGSELVVDAKSGDPYLVLSPRLIPILRPAHDFRLFGVRALLAVATASFFFCFLYSWIEPLGALWNRDALWAFAGAVAIRALFFANYRPGPVSDSLLFERYLDLHIYMLPGIRGIVYPLFLALFPPRATALFVTQSALGALGAVMVLLLLRSLKKPSGWDIVYAVAATSLPTLVAMEMIVLSESLSAFLLLAALMAFRSLQLYGFNVSIAAGLGASCALLYHTKPQFGYVIVLFALALFFTAHLRSLWKITAFAVPVIALQVLVIYVNVTSGNFRGVTSTLGYSLFDHAQQLLTCPGTDTDPHIRYYCQARAAIGNAGNPTGYTAWVMYPTMHGLEEPFYEATADYARLSFRLLAAHPLWYGFSAARSFWAFWADDVPMVPALVGNHGAKVILPLDRYLRVAIEVCFFLSLAGLLFRPLRGDRVHFCVVVILLVLGSAAVQALAESGNEQGRFAVPTMPLLMIATVYLASRLREPRIPI
jgi:hypothetical protein